jgi:hypothetical protein
MLRGEKGGRVKAMLTVEDIQNVPVVNEGISVVTYR